MHCLAIGTEARKRMRKAFGSRAWARSAQDGALQRGDGAGLRAGRAAKAEHRVLEQRQCVTGASPPSAAYAARRANTPASVWLSASPPELSTATCQRFKRRDDTAGQRAVGGYQRRGFARRFDCLAQNDGDGERFLLGIGGPIIVMLATALSAASAKSLVFAVSLPALGRCRRPQSFQTPVVRGHAAPAAPAPTPRCA